MNKILQVYVVSLVGIMALSGCVSNGGVQSSQNTQTEMPRIVGDIPAGSPFSKITIGMPMGQVSDLIGVPGDQTSYVTGKAFIPFYFGSDRSRVEAYYKGQGRITFTGGSGFGGRSHKVYRIVYDPSENGYNEK